MHVLRTSAFVALALLPAFSSFAEENPLLRDMVRPDAPLVQLPSEAHDYASSREQADIAWNRVQRMAVLMDRLNGGSDERAGAENGRLFHFENEGVLLGTAFIPERISPGMRHGLFAEPPLTSWPVMLRYSDGIGWPRRNSPFALRPADVRGLMIERFVFDPARPLAEQTIRVHDFLMTNGPVPFGNIDRFLEFAEVNQDRGFLASRFLLFDLLRLGGLITRSTVRPVRHLFNEQFFSGHAYRLNETEAFQFNVVTQNAHLYRRALLPSVAASLGRGNYLRDRLYEDAGQRPTRLLLRAKKENRNRALTPVENVLVEWTEQNSPSEIVLVIDIPVQAPMPALQRLADSLAHSPRHFTHMHHPVGLTGWGRLPIYDHLSRMRGAIPAYSAAEQEAYRNVIELWRELNAAQTCNARVAVGQ